MTLTDGKIVKDYGLLEGHYYFPREIASFAFDAGFRLRKLVMAVTIALAESDGYGHARHLYVNAEGQTVATDRGMWQLHSFWHKEVSDECAYDPACAAKQVYRITKGGIEWGQWASYESKIYKNYKQKAIKGVINMYYFRWRQKPIFFEELLADLPIKDD